MFRFVDMYGRFPSIQLLWAVLGLKKSHISNKNQNQTALLLGPNKKRVGRSTQNMILVQHLCPILEVTPGDQVVLKVCLRSFFLESLSLWEPKKNPPRNRAFLRDYWPLVCHDFIFKHNLVCSSSSRVLHSTFSKVHEPPIEYRKGFSFGWFFHM